MIEAKFKPGNPIKLKSGGNGVVIRSKEKNGEFFYCIHSAKGQSCNIKEEDILRRDENIKKTI